MIGKHEVRTLAGLRPVGKNPRRQGIDIPRVVIVVVDETSLRQPTPTLQGAAGAIEHRARGRRTILRVQGQHSRLLTSCFNRGSRAEAMLGVPKGLPKFPPM